MLGCLVEELSEGLDFHDRSSHRPGSVSVISWSSQLFPSGSANDAKVRYY
jgi:hypothetical protein